MACDLAREFLCTSVSNFRVAEDSIAVLLLIFIMAYLIYLIYNVVKEGPLKKRLWVLVIGLIPFLIWKFIGAARRIFLDNPPYLLSFEFGETFEALSGLFILISFIYFYYLVKPKKFNPSGKKPKKKQVKK